MRQVCYYDVNMRWERSSLPTILAVTLWVVVSPLMMAFGPCATMGMPCEGTCSATFSPTERADPASRMPLVATVAEPGMAEPSSPSLKVPKPPPKFLFASA